MNADADVDSNTNANLWASEGVLRYLKVFLGYLRISESMVACLRVVVS